MTATQSQSRPGLYALGLYMVALAILIAGNGYILTDKPAYAFFLAPCLVLYITALIITMRSAIKTMASHTHNAGHHTLSQAISALPHSRKYERPKSITWLASRHDKAITSILGILVILYAPISALQACIKIYQYP